jgi:hypothetical protein
MEQLQGLQRFWSHWPQDLRDNGSKNGVTAPRGVP